MRAFEKLGQNIYIDEIYSIYLRSSRFWQTNIVLFWKFMALALKKWTITTFSVIIREDQC